jgi:hypothetical protein
MRGLSPWLCPIAIEEDSDSKPPETETLFPPACDARIKILIDVLVDYEKV